MHVTLPSLEHHHYDETEFSWLWFLAALTYGVGDIVTTVALVQFSPAVGEANAPLQYMFDAFGVSGLVALKLAVFAACIGVALAGVRDDDRLLYYGPPALLALVGAFTTAFNLRLLIG